MEKDRIKVSKAGVVDAVESTRREEGMEHRNWDQLKRNWERKEGQ